MDKPWPLVGYLEIAARAGVVRPVVTMWRKRHVETFPTPVAELEVGPVWYWPEIATWLDQTGRGYDENAVPEPTGQGERFKAARAIGGREALPAPPASSR
jgi:hypothetical protein